MTVLALRPRGAGRARDRGDPPSPKTTAFPRVEGTFPCPAGGSGTLAGSLRLRRLLISAQGSFVAGTVTGQLRDASGAYVGAASRSVTAAADLVRKNGRTTAVVHPFKLDLMGLSVSVDAFELEPTIAVAQGGATADSESPR